MRRYRLQRIIAALIGVVAGLSGPALALTHGIAHARYSAAARHGDVHLAGRAFALTLETTEAAARTGATIRSELPAGDMESLHCQQCAGRGSEVRHAVITPATVQYAADETSSAPTIAPRAIAASSSHEQRPDQPRPPPLS
jgi:hypothetical protein